MAYGNVASYEPTELPGAYRFTDRTGNSWMLHGPTAEDLKARLDAANAMQPQPTAKLTPAQRIAAQNTAAGQAAMANPFASDVPTPAPGAAPAPAAGQPTASAPASAGPEGFKSRGHGIYEGPDGRLYQYSAGSAGSKGGLTLRSETRQDVQPVDPQFLEDQDQYQADRTEALKQQQAAEREQANLALEHKQEMERMAANAAAEEEKRNIAVNTRLADIEQQYDKAEKDVANTKIDPNGGGNFLEALILGLGTAGSILTKQPNLTHEIIQRRIDRHIAAQEKELNVKREAKNDLARMLDVTRGDRDAAKAALETAYTRKAQATFEARAAATGDQALKATHLAQAADMGAAYGEKRKAWTDAQRGRVTQSYVNAPAQAARAAGLVPLNDQLGTELNLQKVAKGEAAASANATGKVDAKQAAGLRAGIQAVERLQQKLQERGNAGGGTGLAEDDSIWAGEVDAAVPLIDAAKQGGAPNESTMGDLKSGLKSFRGKRIQAQLIAEKKILQDRLDALEKGAAGAPAAEQPKEEPTE